jgi:hypothetical protein
MTCRGARRGRGRVWGGFGGVGGGAAQGDSCGDSCGQWSRVGAAAGRSPRQLPAATSAAAAAAAAAAYHEQERPGVEAAAGRVVQAVRLGPQLDLWQVAASGVATHTRRGRQVGRRVRAWVPGAALRCAPTRWYTALTRASSPTTRAVTRHLSVVRGSEMDRSHSMAPWCSRSLMTGTCVPGARTWVAGTRVANGVGE